MASNERENARREKIEKKNKRNRTVIWVILIIVVAILLVLKACEIDFDAVKARFTDSNGKFTLSATADVDSYPYTLDSSDVIEMNMYNDKLNVLTDTSLTVINPANAKKMYSFDHGFAEPILSHCGNYFCMIDQGGTRLRLDTNKDSKYEMNLDNPVLVADVAKNGNVIYATAADDCKSQVVVTTSSLKKVFTYKANEGYVTDVAIDPSGKRVAVVTVNSVNAGLVSTVSTFSISDEKPKAQFKYEGTNILDIHYSSSRLFVVGDDCLSVITSYKNKKDVLKAGHSDVRQFYYTDNGGLAIDYAKYENSVENTISYISSSGKIKNEISLKKRITSLSVTSNKIVVLFDDCVNVYSLRNGEKKKSFSVEEGTKSAILIGNNLYVHRGQLIEIKE